MPAWRLNHIGIDLKDSVQVIAAIILGMLLAIKCLYQGIISVGNIRAVNQVDHFDKFFKCHVDAVKSKHSFIAFKCMAKEVLYRFVLLVDFDKTDEVVATRIVGRH